VSPMGTEGGRVDVLHVLPTNQRRGAETFAYELHRELAGRGHRSEVAALVPGDSGELLPVPSLGPRRFSVLGARVLRRRATTARVVVAHGSNTLLACATGLAGLDVPFIYVNIGDPRFWAATPARRARVRWMLGRAARIAAISPGSRSALLHHFGLDPARVEVIPNGRPARRFPPADADSRLAARRELGLPEHGAVVAVLGALGTEKRVDIAIEAAALMPDVTFAIAGDGPERAKLAALAAKRAPGRVVFLGTTDRPATVLAAAEVLALSSDSEGVPGVLIEAGLAGLPVVATDVGWVGDVVIHRRTGLLVPPRRPDVLASALREAIDRREVYGGAARERCLAQFEMGPITDRWVRLVGDVSRPLGRSQPLPAPRAKRPTDDANRK
jgi:glycosyltransferase involved in cell wall biosynthesis